MLSGEQKIENRNENQRRRRSKAVAEVRFLSIFYFVFGSPAIARTNRGWGIITGGGARAAAAAGPTAPTMAAASRHQHRGNQDQSGTSGAQLHGSDSFSRLG